MYLFSAEDRKKFGSISSDTRLAAHCAEAIIEIWEKQHAPERKETWQKEEQIIAAHRALRALMQ